MKKKTGIIMGLMAAVLMMGIQAGADVLAYDGFDSAATADAANGVYANDWLGTAPNNAVVGGNMVGVQASDTWTAEATFRIDDGKMGLKDSWDATRAASRAITADMTGKTVAWASATMSAYMPDYGSSYNPLAIAGFSDSTFGSYAGAGLGFRWNLDTDQWDIAARYRANSTWAYTTVQASVGTDTGDYFLLWKMDDTNDELSIWVDPTDTSSAATVVISGYQGEADRITHMNVYTYRLNDSLLDGINMFTVDDLTLGDEMVDVIPEPATLSLLLISSIGLLTFRKYMEM